jgi:hypothetical protein
VGSRNDELRMTNDEFEREKCELSIVNGEWGGKFFSYD